MKTQHVFLPPKDLPTTTLHVYLVIKADMLNIEYGLNPCEWGWIRSGDLLIPVMTELLSAPEIILNVIRCNCKITSKDMQNNAPVK